MKEPFIIYRKTRNPLINAEKLHKLLRVPKDFREWIAKKIRVLGFAENRDFFLVFYNKNNERIPFTDVINVARLDYMLPLEAGKKLAMEYTTPHAIKIIEEITRVEIANGLLPEAPKPEVVEAKAEEIIETVIAEEVPQGFFVDVDDISEHPDLISTLQIADIAEKLHKNVMADVRGMCERGHVTVVVGIPATIDNEEVIVIETEREVNQGMGRIRKYKVYLLNQFAAEVLAVDYDVPKRIAMIKLFHKMKIALEEKPKTVILEAYNMTFTKAAELLGVNNRQLLDAFRKNRYLRQNNQPYDKYIALGYFTKERYNPNHSQTRTMLTSTKGFPLAQEILNKTASLPAVVREAVPSIIEQPQSLLPAVMGEFMNRVNEQETTLMAMINHMLMAKAGVRNPIEEEKYMTALKTFQKNYLSRNPE